MFKNVLIVISGGVNYFDISVYKIEVLARNNWRYSFNKKLRHTIINFIEIISANFLINNLYIFQINF